IFSAISLGKCSNRLLQPLKLGCLVTPPCCTCNACRRAGKRAGRQADGQPDEAGRETGRGGERCHHNRS
ncbi:hypothetical protein TSMEX_011549, partial [Taenia solium]